VQWDNMRKAVATVDGDAGARHSLQRRAGTGTRGKRRSRVNDKTREAVRLKDELPECGLECAHHKRRRREKQLCFCRFNATFKTGESSLPDSRLRRRINNVPTIDGAIINQLGKICKR
jgi:hypothetical protein